MSTYQTAATSFEPQENPVERALAKADGAVYGTPDEPPARPPADAGACRNCGTIVKNRAKEPGLVLRIFGDEHDRVPACPDCTESESYSAAIRHVTPTTDQARKRSKMVFYRRESENL